MKNLCVLLLTACTAILQLEGIPLTPYVELVRSLRVTRPIPWIPAIAIPSCGNNACPSWSVNGDTSLIWSGRKSYKLKFNPKSLLNNGKPVDCLLGSFKSAIFTGDKKLVVTFKKPKECTPSVPWCSKVSARCLCFHGANIKNVKAKIFYAKKKSKTIPIPYHLCETTPPNYCHACVTLTPWQNVMKIVMTLKDKIFNAVSIRRLKMVYMKACHPGFGISIIAAPGR